MKPSEQRGYRDALPSRLKGGALPALGAVLLGTVLAAALPASAAYGPESASVHGEFRFTRAAFETGTGFSSDSIDAISARGGPTPLLAHWAVGGSRIVVNWTHEWGASIAHPLSPGTGLVYQRIDGDTGESVYADGRATSAVNSSWAELLVVSSPSGPAPHVAGTAFNGIEISPSRAQKWNTGLGSSSDPASPLRKDYLTREGNAIVAVAADLRMIVRGDFSLYVWYGDLHVEGSAEPRDTFKTGQWTEPGPGSTGVVNYGHKSLVVLHVFDGSLDLVFDSGIAQVEAPALSATTTGTIAVDAQSAYLESNEHVYTASEQPLRVDGDLSLDTTRIDGSPEQLQGVLDGTSFSTDLVPAAPRTDAREDASDGQDGTKVGVARNVPAAAGPVVARAPEPSIWVVLAYVSLGVAVLLAAGTWRLASPLRAGARGPASPAAPSSAPLLLQAAEAALVAGDGPGARGLVKQLLSSAPPNLDAWFIHGASLLQEGAPSRAVRDLEPVAKKVRNNRAGLAFLLCLAYAKLGKWARARRWSRVAATDPDFRVQLERDETFAPLRLKGPRPVEARVENQRPANVVDVAYA